MATWREVSLECRNAAKNLLQGGYFRSSINRSYYAAYGALSGKLEGKVIYKEGRDNPAHADLPVYILRNLDALSRQTRFGLVKAVGRLWKARVIADYIPATYIDRTIALNALRDANTVLLALGVQDE
ncbi:MAG: HEPN domain-containing protein [Janthinobacterium lividum]